MNKPNPKIAYDKESQALSIEMSKAKSVDSDIKDNMVIDYDRKGNMVRVNFYDFNFSSFRNGQKALKRFAKRSDAIRVVN